MKDGCSTASAARRLMASPGTDRVRVSGGAAVISRRDLIAAFAVVITQAGLVATQEKQKPREQDLKTVTLIIEGMT